MQNVSFVGKVYNLESVEDKKGNLQRVKFRLAVRKKFVTDEEKKKNQYNVFVPFVAFGKTAELIDEHIQDGSVIGVSNCEYATFEFENKDGDTVYGHNFKVGSLEFLPRTADDDEDGGSKKSRSKSKKRRNDDDDDEEETPRRKKKRATKEAPKKKRRPEPEDDEDDDDYEDYDDVDDEDVPF